MSCFSNETYSRNRRLDREVVKGDWYQNAKDHDYGWSISSER